MCVCLCVCARARAHPVVSDSLQPHGLIACWDPLSMEYWSELPFPSPEDLPDPGTIPPSLAAPALAGRLSTAEPPGKPTCKAL